MSKVSFTFFLLLSGVCSSAGVNVGTTLFTLADTKRECWQTETIALLTSRMILEDLLPNPAVIIIDSNEFVSDLVEYFRLIIEAVKAESYGKTKRITLTALTDLLGGYLYHAVLPVARYAYYAGMIDYESVESLNLLFDEIKYYLRTNGHGWAKPLRQNVDNFPSPRISINAKLLEPCNGLVLSEHEKTAHGNCGVSIPMPFFDSTTRPSAVALPYKQCALYNTGANTSAYLIMKFFIKSFSCLGSRNTPPESYDNFISQFCMWIDKKAVPMLDDDKFYSIYGGILRVRTTIKRIGMKQANIENEELELEQHVKEGGGKGLMAEVTEARKISNQTIILMIVIIIIIIMLVIGLSILCCRMCRGQGSEDGSTKDEPKELKDYFKCPRCKCLTKNEEDDEDESCPKRWLNKLNCFRKKKQPSKCICSTCGSGTNDSEESANSRDYDQDETFPGDNYGDDGGGSRYSNRNDDVSRYSNRKDDVSRYSNRDDASRYTNRDDNTSRYSTRKPSDGSKNQPAESPTTGTTTADTTDDDDMFKSQSH